MLHCLMYTIECFYYIIILSMQFICTYIRLWLKYVKMEGKSIQKRYFEFQNNVGRWASHNTLRSNFKNKETKTIAEFIQMAYIQNLKF